jgi:hypothetical protein
LLNHYQVKGVKTQAGEPHENGDIEQRNHRYKRAVEQTLLLRGSRDFNAREEYAGFLADVFRRLNSGRRERFQEECRVLRSLPKGRLSDCKRERVKVGPGSTIRLQHNVYSVPSSLTGEWVEARLYAEQVEIWYGQSMIERMPRLRGENNHRINYRHIIDSLVRKPGAFGQFRYRDDLFPTIRYRMAYDLLKETMPCSADKEYVKILQIAASESETGVDDALRMLFDQGLPVSSEAIRAVLSSAQKIPPIREVRIDAVDLGMYDRLLDLREVG